MGMSCLGSPADKAVKKGFISRQEKVLNWNKVHRVTEVDGPSSNDFKNTRWASNFASIADWIKQSVLYYALKLDLVEHACSNIGLTE